MGNAASRTPTGDGGNITGFVRIREEWGRGDGGVHKHGTASVVLGGMKIGMDGWATAMVECVFR